MRLKKVKILGFKSFADKTICELDDGITAVVGPNGCGKSNFSDAIRWVLGDQSSKSMRAEKMQDVIFSGSASRRASNVAEVSITFDQVQGALPIEFDEVTITRILHRDGDSDYQINGKTVRLKDIQALLWDTGLGKEALSSIGQGQIEQVISMSPYERRSIFEEAAGILRFKQRKKEALSKLEGVDGNLKRVMDVHREVSEQLKILKEQAETATRHKAQILEVERLEKAVLVEEWKSLEKRRQDLESGQGAFSSEIADLRSKVDAKNAEIAEARRTLAALNEEGQTLQKAIYLHQGQIQTKEALIASSKKQTEELLQLQARLAEEEAEARQKAATLETLLIEQRAQVKSREEASIASKTLTAKAREAAIAAAALFDAARQQAAASQKQHLSLVQEENNWRLKLKENRVRDENAKAQESSAQKALADATTKKADLEERLSQAKKLESEQAELATSKAKLFAEATQAFLTGSQKSKEKISELTTLKNTFTEQEARQKALLRLKKDQEGLGQAAKLLLKENSDPKSKLHQKLSTLSDHFLAKKGLEKAVAGRLSNYSQTLVVQTTADFSLVLDFAKSKKLDGFSLSCEEDWQKPGEFLEKGSAHFFAGYKLLEQATNSPKALLGKEGTFVDDCGVYFSPSSASIAVFERVAELSSLEDTLSNLQKTITDVSSECAALQAKEKELESSKLAADKEARSAEMRLIELRAKAAALTGEEKSLALSLAASISSLDKISTLLAELASSRIEIEEKLEQASQASSAALKRMQAEEEKIAALEKAAMAASKDLDEKRGTENTALSHLASAENAIKLTEQSLLNLKELESKQHARREEAIATQYKLAQNLATINQQLLSTREELATALARAQETDKRVSLHKSALRAFDEGLKQLSEQLKAKEIAQASTQNTFNTISQQLAAATSAIELRFERPAADVAQDQLEAIESLEKAQKRIATLRKSLEKNGDVNLAAIAEFDKHKTRHEFIETQVADLEASKKELVEIVSKLDSTSRRQFKKTLEAIRTNFKKHFATLFEGGEADLVYTDSKDVLEAGIEILAKPPQKQLRSISLMSGGEKCLTAMALLFSIFETRPSAFCILDEIDAPLDDTNVGRFLNVVKDFNHKTQFIIVTHNKITMAAANSLYGVSMQERGVSRLLQLTLDAALV